jgi:aryl-alcohol dehydrogenase-like predicted oxidoreductase
VSLKRLGTDYIDLYQMHWPDHNTPVEETMRALDDLVKAGKVRHVGVSNFDVPLLEQALSVRHVDSEQPPYSLLNRAAEDEILPFCEAHGIGVVPYSPLFSGLLSGRYTSSTMFHPDDWRTRNPEFTGEGLACNVAKVERLRPIAERYGRTIAQLALAWVLANPAITSAIVGMRRSEHVTSSLPAVGLHLDAHTYQEVTAALEGD